MAYGLGKDDAYFDGLAAEMQRKRDRLAAGLASVGLEVLPCHGTYFISTDFRPLGFNGDDVAFCKHLTTEARVAAVPVSAFYQGEGAPQHFARFAFCKDDKVIDEAIARLQSHFGGRTLRQAQGEGKK